MFQAGDGFWRGVDRDRTDCERLGTTVSYQRQEDDDDGLGLGGGAPGVDDVRDDDGV